MVRREREGVRWLATKPGRTELSALVAKQEMDGVLAAPLRDRQRGRRRRRKRGIGGEDDRGRPRRGECGK